MATRTRWRTAAVLAALALAISACAGDDASTTTSTTEDSQPGSTTSVPTTPVEPDMEDTMPTGSTDAVFEAGPIDPGLEPLIDMAIADLAARLEIDPSDIEVISGVLVIWPDSSLGCPEPDMVYTPATEDGSIIELGASGRVFRYHTGGRTFEPFLCDQPLKSVPPTVGSEAM